MLKFCILLSARLPLPVITVPLLAVQSGLPGCLAFEPLCLNTCARVGAGVVHAYTHARERLCAGKGPFWGPGQVKLPWASCLHHFVVTFGTYLLPFFLWFPHQRAGLGKALPALSLVALCHLRSSYQLSSVSTINWKPDHASLFPAHTHASGQTRLPAR